MHPDHQFDQQIDEVARELITPEPDVRLRPLVIARLPRRPAIHASTPFVALALAAVLLFISSGWLTTTSQPTAPDTRPGPIDRTTGGPNANLTNDTSLLRVAAVRSAVVPDTGDRENEVAVESALPALAAPATLTLPALEPEPITVPLLDMRSVAAAPIEVTPIPAISPIRGLVPTGQS